MNTAKPAISVLTHLYYEDGFDTLKEDLKKLVDGNVQFLFNISADNTKKKELLDEIKSTFPASIVTVSPNKGKDIGGKFVLLDLCLKLNMKADFYIFLHDKQSRHNSFGETWRKKLLRIIDPQKIKAILELYDKQKKLGIVSAKEFVANEYDRETDSFDSTNEEILKTIINQYGFNLNTFDFIGGTMFWIRAGILNDFFGKYSALNIRATFETGNVLDDEKGTNVHAWERALSWISTHQGYTIKGI